MIQQNSEQRAQRLWQSRSVASQASKIGSVSKIADIFKANVAYLCDTVVVFGLRHVLL